jgi:hypothetical protein
MRLLEPALHLASTAPGALAQMFVDLGADFLGDAGFPSRRLFALQHGVNASLIELVEPLLHYGARPPYGLRHPLQGVEASAGHLEHTELLFVSGVLGATEWLIELFGVDPSDTNALPSHLPF